MQFEALRRIDFNALADTALSLFSAFVVIATIGAVTAEDEHLDSTLSRLTSAPSPIRDACWKSA